MTMDGLKQRQENILEKLKQIKEKLNNLSGSQKAFTTVNAQSSSNIASLEKQGINLIEKIDALKDHLLTIKKINTQPEQSQSVECVEKQQEFILEQLLGLKSKMNYMAVEKQMDMTHQGNEDLKCRQLCLLQIIDSLQVLLKTEIHSLQDNKGNEAEMDLEKYHTEVLTLIEGLHRELEKVLNGLQCQAMEMEKHDCNCNDDYLIKDYKWDRYPTSFPDTNKKGGVIHDIVVSANPSNPPYFLLPIKKLLQPHLRILSLSSVHSSVSEVDPATLRLFREETLKERGEYDVAFTVLWKNQTTKSMMVNPLTQSVISGEANILRYISRLFPAVSSLHYELRGSFVGVSESDYWLDAIQTKLLHGTNKERQSVFKQLNAKLGTSKWVDGDSWGLCDVFCWSVILQLGSSKDLPSNVANWFKRIAQETGINID
ncbi:UNVERIFIED_CONTAM: hypothetical protein GTU68_051768 [Idotea baltica]|nr:hypothetical protein [Idotea baltica]